MEFYPNQYFHVFNQGNNKRKIFFDPQNYSYFLLKAGAYISPFARIIAYCLMPNHFHFLLYVHSTSISKNLFRNYVENYFTLYFLKKNMVSNRTICRVSDYRSDHITLNEAVAIMQRSYTRAINHQFGWSGSLFRDSCKAKDGWISKFITVEDPEFHSGSNYVKMCIEYIHNNPVQAGLVQTPTEWEFSSARDYAGQGSNSICDLKIGNAL